MARREHRSVALWLFICCALIYAMVVLGGVTRLTHSGLSMVDWEPIMGVVPPLTEHDWRSTFEHYQQFPEYQKVNRGMSLAGFKAIFYLEYAHRMLGRLIGLAFLLPLVVFSLRGRIRGTMMPRLGAIFVLGGLQGFLGWFMVRSGLNDRPSVSQYRLVAHLLMAILIYSLILWTALGLWRGTARRTRAPATWHRFGWVALAVVAVMIASGGFVAGTRAGFVFNTFPLMAGHWIPPDVWSLEPGWRNLFENVATVQFLHRIWAAMVATTVVVYWLGSLRGPASGGLRWSPHLMLLALVVQVLLGITTLLYRVPVALGASHQAGAIMLLSLVLIHTHILKYSSRWTGPIRQPAVAALPGGTPYRSEQL